MGLILPCALEEPGCETTSLDPYAYIWDYPDNLFFILRIEEVNMVKQNRKTMSLVVKTLHSSLCLKSRIIHKNIVESPHLFTQQTTIHCIWLNSVKVLIWKLEEILAARRMVQLIYFSIWDPVRKMSLVNFMCVTLVGGNAVTTSRKPRQLLEHGLWNAPWNENRLSLLPKIKTRSSDWDTATTKPVWTKRYPDPQQLKTSSGKSPVTRLYAHKKQIHVLGNKWQPCLALSLSNDSLTNWYDESMLSKNTYTVRMWNSICRSNYMTNLSWCRYTNLFR